MRPELPNPVTLPRSPDLAPAMPFEASDLQAASGLGEGTQPPRPRPAPRAPIDSTLPPDYPLEPGARSQAKSAAERLAGSEPADAAPASGEGSSKSNFIAAARRAAQAAAAANVEKSGRLTAATDAARSAVSQGRAQHPHRAIIERRGEAIAHPPAAGRGQRRTDRTERLPPRDELPRWRRECAAACGEIEHHRASTRRSAARRHQAEVGRRADIVSTADVADGGRAADADWSRARRHQRYLRM